ncbi:MAG: leucine-rich repeat-containing serine/threonine-protein kinase [Burkholderiaceae bacterium]|nr:leucine-rich repeat-containing serine/threonine-protein kinase [Burkholderiaceae bacterium]
MSAGPGEDPAATLAALRRGDLAGARSLTLRGGLTELPQEIFALADTLEQLDLSGNALTALPADFARLTRLEVLFASGNRFERLPPVLGDCPALQQIGMRGCGLRELPGEALPPALRWLTLTDNALTQLPAALGERPALQKLMLAGNRLQGLPASLVQARSLELLRLSANRLEAWPGWLGELPRLAWLAWAGNPLEPDDATPIVADVPWSRLQIGALLGEGASGRIHRAVWQPDLPAADAAAGRAVAVKLFKGAMTSDGLPEREMAACLAAGAHPCLVAALGRVSDAPGGQQALVMPLLPSGWQTLAAPPSLASCSRDVYDPGLRLPDRAVLRLLGCVADAMAHLHRRGWSHGDLYAHNMAWDPASGAAVLSDFGASSRLLPGFAGQAQRRFEVRAWGLLAEELLDRCESDLPDLRELARACAQPIVSQRPDFDALAGQLAAGSRSV